MGHFPFGPKFTLDMPSVHQIVKNKSLEDLLWRAILFKILSRRNTDSPIPLKWTFQRFKKVQVLGNRISLPTRKLNAFSCKTESFSCSS